MNPVIVPVPASRIRRYTPRIEWFERGADAGIHGMAHTARVIVFSLVLAEMAPQEGLLPDPHALGWAAALHDIKRVHDFADSTHGEKAAGWIRRHLPALDPTVDVEKVAFLCTYHSRDDHDAPILTDDLKIFKDADALDRWRWPLGDFGGPAPSFFRTASARALYEVSRHLCEKTDPMRNHPERALDRVIDMALFLKLLSYP